MIREIPRKQCLLDVARDVDLFFHALALAFTYDESGIVQNAGGVGGQRVENLAVEF